MRLLKHLILLLIISFSLTGCLYFNLYYNFNKAYNQALEIHDDRITENPDDTIWVTKEEKEKLRRTISKGSKILEVYPSEIEYKPKVLFFMGDAFYRMTKWKKAITKYNEFEKYFPYHDSIPNAQYHKAYCHYKTNELPVAYYELQQIIDEGPTHPYYNEGVLLLAEVSQGEEFSKNAIENIEKLLQSDISSAYTRGKLHYQVAELYFTDEDYGKALIHYASEDIKELSDNNYYTAFHKQLQCHIKLEQIDEGLDLVTSRKTDPRLIDHQLTTDIIHARLLLKAEKYTPAVALLDSVIGRTSKEELPLKSESHFILAEHYHYTMGDLEQARTEYINAYKTTSQTPWYSIAQERAKALKTVAALSGKKGRSFKEFFKAAELYLFTLNNPDSAINSLNKVVSEQKGSTLERARAAYAKAFITDAFLMDSTKAYTLYEGIIVNYPETKYAQQAEKNLGRTQTVVTANDKAHTEFLAAESLYFSLDSISLINPSLYDSLEVIAVNAYDSVSQAYPNTEYGIKAHYTLAWIYEYQRADTAAARVMYKKIVKSYPGTPYADIAKDKLSPKLSITERQLDKLRKNLDQTVKREERRQKRAIERKTKQETIEEAEELLETDFNKMYEFGK
ncbi:MAG: tetratricopeptide repeat protein [Fibrobacterales bacterium]